MQKLEKQPGIMVIKRGVLALLTLSLLILVTNSHAARFFRYIDENGKLVLSGSIPNDRVKYGYEVVDESARVLQKIEPQLTEAQYQEKRGREAALKKCRQAIDRVQNLFQSQSDIDYAEEQALTSIENQIVNTKANLSHVRNQREELEMQAAQMDLSGKPIANTFLDNIESATRLLQLPALAGKSIEIKYKMERSGNLRAGTFCISASTSGVAYHDDFVESDGDVGVTLTAELDNLDSTTGNETVVVKYATTTDSSTVTMDYVVTEMV